MGWFGHPKHERLSLCWWRRFWVRHGLCNRGKNDMLLNLKTTAGNGKQWSGARRLALVLGCLSVCLWASVPLVLGQSSASPAPNGQQQTAPPQQQGIPDAPSAVQPPAPAPEPPPIPKPEEKKPVERDPWTNQPIYKPATAEPGAGTSPAPVEGTSATPAMPPVKTVPPGSSTKQGPNAQEQLYTFTVHPAFVQIPVTVKDRNGRVVDGLLSTDFSVKENGTVQKLSFFTADPFALSVAIVLDLGMPDAAVQKVNETFPALVGAFAPYDEVALYTYSSTVSEVTDFAGASQKLTALLNQMKTERGRNNGVAILNGPLAQNGPMINGIPLGSPTEPVNTPTREAHVLNDAILQAALNLRRRDRTRRKIIFVISDGRESGSKASYNDVKKVLLTNEIQVQAVAVGSAALPVYDKIERIHLPLQGYDNLLPKYASATGGGEYPELSRNSIEDMYAQVMSEARNQYTLGYTPTAPKTPTAVAYRDIEVVVHKPGLKVTAKAGYYPVQGVPHNSPGNQGSQPSTPAPGTGPQQ
jgi:VWFA-related protein